MNSAEAIARLREIQRSTEGWDAPVTAAWFGEIADLIEALRSELEDYRGLAENAGAQFAVSERDTALAACAVLREDNQSHVVRCYKAEAACAEMRCLLDSCGRFIGAGFVTQNASTAALRLAIQQALISSTGSGYLSPEAAEQLRSRCLALEQALREHI